MPLNAWRWPAVPRKITLLTGLLALEGAMRRIGQSFEQLAMSMVEAFAIPEDAFAKARPHILLASLSADERRRVFNLRLHYEWVQRCLKD